ncbi:unnamed protein product [Brassica rapa subsp. trilocularis]
MGASRKLQGVIDLVLKKVQEEMERFKICEKETKTKAFSKEGLCQQPKTDPKEKAKSETRDWLNNVVNELESQIDSFEAELEGLSVKKGNTKPPRLVSSRNIMGVESNVQPLTSPLSKIVLPPTAKGNDGTTSDINPSEVAAMSFQSQNETVIGSVSNIVALLVSFSPLLEHTSEKKTSGYFYV